MNDPGWVYILTNEAMPGFVKLGLSRANDVAVRIKQLDTTSVPLPFECHYAARVPDCAKLEKTLKFVFGDRRPRIGREFFRIDPDTAKAIIELVAIEDVKLSDSDQAIDPVQRRDIDEEKNRREVRTFTSLGIAEGTELTFLKDHNVTCTVVEPRKVLFRGQKLSPTRAALIAVREMGYNWSNLSGMDYWTLNGTRLSGLPGSTEANDDLAVLA